MIKEMDFTGKVAIVTGGAKGLGGAISLAFARAGASVAIISRTKRDLKKIEEEIRNIFRKEIKARREEENWSRKEEKEQKKATRTPLLTFCGDISKEEYVKRFIEKTKGKFGRIDFLVNNAATYIEKKIDETSLYEFENIVKVNLTGTFLVTREAVKHMKAQKSGHIFTISSVGGRLGLSGKSAYCASKFGVTGLSKALAKELKEFGIKVQIIYPYYVDSYGAIDWAKEGKQQLSSIKPEDVADMILYHASLPLRVLNEDIIFEPFMK